MDTSQELDRVVEIEKQIAILQAEQVRLIAGIADDPDGDQTGPFGEKEYFREELRTALGESAVAVSTRVDTARTLVRELPLTLTALERGELRMRHVRALCDATLGLSPDETAQLEARCVPFAAGRDYTAFARKIRRELAAVQSMTLEENLAALLEGRRVWCVPDHSAATATFGAVLPADGARVVMTAIDQAAGLVPKDDPRTRDQREADGLVRIAQDWLDNDQHTPNGKHRGPAVQVTIAASTLLGLDNQPGELAGHCPIPAVLARAIAEDPTGTWRRLVTDNTGQLLDYGRTTYRPPTALANHVRARDRECQFPTCHRNAQHCELDHLTPWTDGGTTSADNLISLCTRHHHTKHETSWTVRRLHNGTLEWTSPTGRTHDKDTQAYPVAQIVDPDDNLADAPITARRAADPEAGSTCSVPASRSTSGRGAGRCAASAPHHVRRSGP